MSNRLKLDQYCLQQKCTQKTLVFSMYMTYGDIREHSHGNVNFRQSALHMKCAISAVAELIVG